MLENTDSVLMQTLLFAYTSLDITENIRILNATTNFIILTKRFDERLFKTKSVSLFLCVSYRNYFYLIWLDRNIFLEYCIIFISLTPGPHDILVPGERLVFNLVRYCVIYKRNHFFYAAHFLKFNFFKIKPVNHS